jgi:hypothetical protein
VHGARSSLIYLILNTYYNLKTSIHLRCFDGVRVAHPFSFLYYVVCVLSFVCLRPVYCVPTVASVYGLSILFSLKLT